MAPYLAPSVNIRPGFLPFWLLFSPLRSLSLAICPFLTKLFFILQVKYSDRSDPVAPVTSPASPTVSPFDCQSPQGAIDPQQRAAFASGQDAIGRQQSVCDSSQDALDRQPQAVYGSCPRYERRADSCSPGYGSPEKGIGGGGSFGRLPLKWERCASYSPSSSVERMLIDSPLSGGGNCWTPPPPPAPALLLAGGSPQLRGCSPLSGEDSTSVLSFSLRYIPMGVFDSTSVLSFSLRGEIDIAPQF